MRRQSPGPAGGEGPGTWPAGELGSASQGARLPAVFFMRLGTYAAQKFLASGYDEVTYKSRSKYVEIT